MFSLLLAPTVYPASNLAAYSECCLKSCYAPAVPRFVVSVCTAVDRALALAFTCWEGPGAGQAFSEFRTDSEILVLEGT